MAAPGASTHLIDLPRGGQLGEQAEQGGSMVPCGVEGHQQRALDQLVVVEGHRQVMQAAGSLCCVPRPQILLQERLQK